VAVVCSGAKSILDLPATLEALETRRVPVIGLGVAELPGFYATSSGLPLAHRVETPEEAARAFALHRSVPGGGGMLVVQPPPAELAIPSDEVEAWIEKAVAATSNLRAGEVTPAILAFLAEASEGRTLLTNIGLVVNNARTAARVAVALAAA
jgi:pseudouridylate synthase